MGVASFSGNQFAERVGLLLTQKKLRHSTSDFFEKVPFDTMKKFTYVQLCILVSIFGITLTPAAMLFPVLIGVLIPLRSVVLPKYFDSDVLMVLDPLEACMPKASLGLEGDEEGAGEEKEGESDAGIVLLERHGSIDSTVAPPEHDANDPIPIGRFSIRHSEDYDPLETVEPVDDDVEVEAKDVE